VITYVRRIIKSPSDASISNDLIIDYINRFLLMDVDARLQLFDYKTKYSFMTSQGVDQYNMPLYDEQIESVDSDGNATQTIASFPVYQGFLQPCYINGVQASFQTQKQLFYSAYPNIVQNLQIVGTGDGVTKAFQFQLPILSNVAPFNLPVNAILRGHVDITGIIATGNNIDPPIVSTLDMNIPSTSIKPAVYITSSDITGANLIVQDSGQFLVGDVNKGLLMEPGNAPFGYLPLQGGYISSFVITGIIPWPTDPTKTQISAANTGYQVGQIVTIDGVVGMTEINGQTVRVVEPATATDVIVEIDSQTFTPYASDGTISNASDNFIDYFTGEINVVFPVPPADGVNISVQCYYFQAGLPRSVLFNNNVITLRTVPDRQYLVELDAYLTPAAFLVTEQAIPFGYMAEYIARGAARKILSDTGDVEQFMFYEPLFKEQEMLVWKRSQRIFTSTRTETLYSIGHGYGNGWGNGYNGGNFL